MKKIISLAFLYISFFTNVFAQVTLTQIPETPLSYLGYELTSPTLKAGYTKRTEYFGTPGASRQIGLIFQQKYSDIPIYSHFSELSDFIGYVDSKTTVTRNTDYVAYVLEVRASSSGAFATYERTPSFFQQQRLLLSAKRFMIPKKTRLKPMHNTMYFIIQTAKLNVLN